MDLPITNRMKKIAVVNFKGGVGKTTIAWLLAKYASESAGKQILIADTDAQMSLTLSVQIQESRFMKAVTDTVSSKSGMRTNTKENKKPSWKF